MFEKRVDVSGCFAVIGVEHAAEPLLADDARVDGRLDLFLGSDMVFIGTSLDRAETDLWWALHVRQRNLARVPPSDRPRTFVLCQGDVAPHRSSTTLTPAEAPSQSEHGTGLGPVTRESN